VTQGTTESRPWYGSSLGRYACTGGGSGRTGGYTAARPTDEGERDIWQGRTSRGAAHRPTGTGPPRPVYTAASGATRHSGSPDVLAGATSRHDVKYISTGPVRKRKTPKFATKVPRGVNAKVVDLRTPNNFYSSMVFFLTVFAQIAAKL
jgi:hypothetical protein